MNWLHTLLLLLPAAGIHSQNDGDLLFDTTIVHEIRFVSDDSNLLNTMIENFYQTFGPPYIYSPVKVLIDGRELDSVGLRIKGGISAFDDKRPLKIDFNHFRPNQKYDGLKKVNLHNMYFDNSMLREILAYNILRTAGLKTCRTAYANVYINDQWQGVYLLVEQIDKTFLRNYFSDNNGTLYKSRGCEVQYESGENTMAHFEQMVDVLLNTPPDMLYDTLEKILHTKSFLQWMAIETIINSVDNILTADCNYFLYHEPRTDLIHGVPWDLNFTFYTSNHELSFSSSNTWLNRMLAVPQYQEIYLEAACRLLDYNFTTDRLYELIDQSAARVRPFIPDDPLILFTLEDFETEILFLKELIAQRIDDIGEDIQLLGKTCESLAPPPFSTAIVINEFMASNDSTSGIADPAGSFPDWIELYNRAGIETSLEGFYLSDDKDYLKRWAFPAETVIPPKSYLIIWADRDVDEEGLHTNFRLDKSGGDLFLVFENLTIIDSISYSNQQKNISFARLPNGSGHFVMQPPTFGYNNENLVTTRPPNPSPKIDLYPNPAAGCFHISLSTPLPLPALRYQLFNLYGHPVQKPKPIEKQTLVKTNHLPEGIYFIEIYSSNNIIGRNKVIIVK